MKPPTSRCAGIVILCATMSAPILGCRNGATPSAQTAEVVSPVPAPLLRSEMGPGEFCGHTGGYWIWVDITQPDYTGAERAARHIGVCIPGALVDRMFGGPSERPRR